MCCTHRIELITVGMIIEIIVYHLMLISFIDIISIARTMQNPNAQLEDPKKSIEMAILPILTVITDS